MLVGEHQYCNNNTATPGLPTLRLSTRYFVTNLEATVLYAQVLVLTVSCHLVSWRKITRSSIQLLWILEEALCVMKERKAYSTEATLLAERKRSLKCKVDLANPT